jgi:hypothetical protein
MRADICSSDDHDTTNRLMVVLGELGAVREGDWEALGVGLHRFRVLGGELTLFVDAWCVDLEGPEEIVRRVLAELGRRDY